MSVTKFSSEKESVVSRYVPVSQLTKWTFEDSTIRSWVEDNINGKVLNPCAGETKLTHDDAVVRNDLNEQIDADYHVDALALPMLFDESSFDTIVFDPPWSLYQSNLRYNGRHVSKSSTGVRVDMDKLPFDVDESKTQIGHARLVKDGFHYLLKPGGTVIQITQHGTCMPGRLPYDRIERVMFDPIGEAKCVIGSIDRSNQNKLTQWI